MTFVGRILVFVIMGFALVFLGISTVVFTTASNWKLTAEAQKKKVDDLTKKNTDAATDLAAAKKDFDKAKGDAAASKKALDDKIASLNGEIEQLTKSVTAARGEVVAAQQNAKTSLDEADARRKETDTLRDQKLAVEKQANEFKIRQTELNDQIRILTRERDVAKKNADDLRDRAARFSSALRQHGLSDDVTQYRALASPPPVHGEVARIDEQNKRMELTIGSDDGLVPGHELELYRLKPRSEYLGKVRILTVEPDRAVAVVVGKTIQGKKIKEGDIVASSFRHGPQL
jgi:hypothetical protein